jgi:hypothetical protein
MQMARRLIALFGAFLVGLAVWPAVSFDHWLMHHDDDLRCLPNSSLCVGAPIAGAAILDASGGVVDISCGPDGSGDIIFFPEFLTRPCTNAAYAIDLSGGPDRTQIWVRSGQVVRIVRGPRHVLDF